MVYSPLARGIKINATRVNSVSSSEPPPTLPILNQPAEPPTQLEEIRRGERKKGVQEKEGREKIRLFSFQHLLSQLGKKRRFELFIRLLAVVRKYSTHPKVTASTQQSQTIFCLSFSFESDASQRFSSLCCLHSSLLCLFA